MCKSIKRRVIYKLLKLLFSKMKIKTMKALKIKDQYLKVLRLYFFKIMRSPKAFLSSGVIISTGSLFFLVARLITEEELFLFNLSPYCAIKSPISSTSTNSSFSLLSSSLSSLSASCSSSVF